jgi:hypothetical protein
MAMKTMKGPALFIAQFAGDKAPFNSLDSIAKWASGLGYKGLQIHSWDPRFIDLKKAAESKTYADEVNGTMKKHGLEITELSTHLQGQLVAVHSAYDVMFDGFAAPEVRGNPKKRQEWAVQQMLYAAKASKNLGLKAHVTFSGCSPGLTSIHGHNALTVSLKRPSRNKPAAGSPSSMPSMRRMWTCVTKSIPAKTFSMATPSSNSTKPWASIAVAASTMMPATSSSRRWTMSLSLITTTHTSRPST